MAGRTNKWLLGCGIGCLVVVVLVAAIGAGGFYVVKTMIGKFAETETVMAEVRSRFGRVSDYRPDPNGRVSPARIETFLAVRERMIPTRRNLERSLALLTRGQKSRGGLSPRRFARMIRAGMHLMPQIVEYYTERNKTLLDCKMGLGEYYYIYAVSYYSWLAMSVTDGPPFRLIDRAGGADDKDWDEADIRDRRRATIGAGLNEQLLPMLRSQLEALSAAADTAATESWRHALRAEIEAMKRDPFRLPWQDGCPRCLAESLAPYRERLEGSYSYLCNPLEVGLRQD
jgi:hypothetical protein